MQIGIAQNFSIYASNHFPYSGLLEYKIYFKLLRTKWKIIDSMLRLKTDRLCRTSSSSYFHAILLNLSYNLSSTHIRYARGHEMEDWN